GRRCPVGAINRPLERLGECRSLTGVDALEDDLIALDDLVDVDSQVPHSGVAGQLRGQTSAEGLGPFTAWTAGQPDVDAHTNASCGTWFTTSVADDFVGLGHALS